MNFQLVIKQQKSISFHISSNNKNIFLENLKNNHTGCHRIHYVMIQGEKI